MEYKQEEYSGPTELRGRRDANSELLKRLESEGPVREGAARKEDSRNLYGESRRSLVWVWALHMQGEADETKQRRTAMQSQSEGIY